MDEQLYLMAVGLSLEEKIEKAIESYRTFESEALKRDPVNGYYLRDSYGKDSCVILDLAKRSGVKFKAHHNLTTLDPPELVMFGRKHHSETEVHRPAVPMLLKMVEKNNGPPTRVSRWCCAIYKESAGKDLIKVFGVRAAESARRKAQWRIWTPLRETNCFALNPILYWTDEDVWRYIKNNNIPYCSLYDEGRKRLGCIGCPMAGNKRIEDFKRWPKYGDAWKRYFKRFWDAHHGTLTLKGEARWFDSVRKDGTKFEKWEDLWDWWMEDKPTAENDDCQMGLF
jgi:phosphoadenosine phosphosulfate reductase